MKRLMLATTAALAIAAPAAAQTSAEATVERTLMTMGYEQATIDMLTDEQVNALFLTITSEGQSEVRTLLESYELTQADGPEGLYDTARDDDTMAVVQSTLMENGYAPGVVNLLTDAEYTELFLAATSEDQTGVDEVISGFEFAVDDAGNMSMDSNAQIRVVNALEARGFTAEQIAMVDDAEKTEIFIALTSGDETDIDEAITSAMNS
ncbi:hypothetical protein [Hasllibacter sp. MH4015]|uniref:hypothetical protein n=1 Tax=Hasllibacter sp. MH4015 TaxID=2854029 RepID=UPI001CD55CCF|nr:hypothetical protein [Hasllibacter sp. MH4015]